MADNTQRPKASLKKKKRTYDD
jgi:uncharacterized membrane protein